VINPQLLAEMTVKLNGHSIYPDLENSFEQYSKDLTAVIEGMLKISEPFPFQLEPAPTYTLER
jgi:hypothetical protein